MRKIIITIVAVLCCAMALAGCGETKKIKNIEVKITQLENENKTKRAALESTKQSIRSGEELYNKTHSNNPEIQAELKKLKSNLSQLRDQASAYEREIALNEVQIKSYKDEIEKLKK